MKEFAFHAGTTKRTVIFGQTKHIFLGSPDEFNQFLADLLDKARRTGEMLTFEDGTKVFYTRDPIVDTTKEGSAQYKWDSRGNLVRCKITKHVVTAKGHDTKTVGTSYCPLD